MENNKIPIKEKPSVADAMASMDEFKKKTVRTILNNSGTLISLFIIIVVGVVMTTEIRFDSAADVASLGLDFFVMLFCSYGMYINLAGSGTKQGLATKIYIEVCARYEELKAKLSSEGAQGKLSAFCEDYVQKELISTRTTILVSVGIDYNTYIEKYIGKDVPEIKEALTEAQRKAIRQANRVKPIKLTPDMIIKRERGSNRRSPLGFSPQAKKAFAFSGKFTTTALTSVLTVWIVLDVIVDPGWNVAVLALMRILAVVVNGFSGYQFGYDNVTVDRVNYMNDQCDLMDQALRFEIK